MERSKEMSKFFLHIILLGSLCLACVKKPEKMVGPTIGSLDIVSDVNMKYIVEQEENIFERTYKYATLNITYTSEYDMIQKFMSDSVKAIMATRALTQEELDFFDKKQMHPRQYAFATGALAFISNKNPTDSTFSYEEIVNMWKDGTQGKLFVIEDAKSGITQEVLRLADATKLPEHFYALASKQEVIDYVITHDNAIGIVDWSDISDSDNQIGKEMLNKIMLLGISRPLDSIQHGFLKPYQYNLQDRLYPFTRDLYFITNTGKNDVGTGFAFFISGEIGQKIVLKTGLLPKFQSERVLELTSSPDIKVIK